MGKFVVQSRAPFLQAGLAIVDFLAPANERYYDRPIAMTIHYLKDRLWFRKLYSVFVSILVCVPRPLCFVKDNDLFHGSFRRLLYPFANEAMHVLDEGINCAIPGDSRRDDLDKRAIAGEKHACRSALLPQCGVMHNIQSGESFACARHSGYETGNLLLFTLCLLNRSDQTLRGSGQIDRARVGMRNLGHVVSSEQGLG